jgi:hypothetical protein
VAGVEAIHSVSSGLATWLGRAHALSPVRNVSCTISLMGTTEFVKLTGSDTTLSILLHRVSHNSTMRNVAAVTAQAKRPLVVDLHYMVTVWADTAPTEQLLLAWVARELHRSPILGRGVIGDGFDNDLVQIVSEEMIGDSVSQLWGMLKPPYRPSLFYVARNVRIDSDPEETFPPVIADRFVLEPSA